MGPKKTHTEWIRCKATLRDKQLLLAITADRENDGFSDTIRQLIREEAKRTNVQLQYATAQAHSEQAA